MTPTRLGNLLAFAAAFAVLAYALAERAYGSLPFPAFAPLPLALLGIAELVVAKLVRDRVRGRTGPRARSLHPLQVARAAVLAKASSVTGAVLAGTWGGLLAWTLPRRAELASAGDAAVVSALTTAASVLVVVAALLLERACRTPPEPPVRSSA